MEKVETGAKCTKEKLRKCGWKFHHGIGRELEFWIQANEVLFFNPLTQEVLRVMPLNVAL